MYLKSSEGFGQPTVSIPVCISRPDWIPKLKHFFAPKISMLSVTYPFTRKWYSTGSTNVLLPDLLNPGYIDPTTHLLIPDPNLDPKLKALIAALYSKSAPFDSDPFKTFVDRGGQLRVALVDLSTDSKLAWPKFAGFNSTHMLPGGSLAKIGLLYAIYQNRFDLNTRGYTDPGSFTADQLRGLEKIYTISHAAGSGTLAFDFNDDIHHALEGICSNCAAGKISRSLGLRYVNSALWQSGLYDCRRAGLWLGAHYNEWDKENKKWECDKAPYHYKGNCPDKVGCRKEPKSGNYIALNALSVATFFTLLAQGRLVDNFSSGKLRDLLFKQTEPGSGCTSRFKMGLTNTGRFAAMDRIYGKIGVTNTVSHEGALIDRASIGKRYVAVVLVMSNAGRLINGSIREQLIEHLDKLVETNP